MNRVDFMQQLENLLQNISPAEKEEALQYYNDYFDDAGPENEQDVLEALGTPAKVAESIKRDLNGNSAYLLEDNADPRSDRRAIVKYQDPEGDVTGQKKEKDENLPTWALVLIIVLCVIASPAILGVCSGVLGVAIGLIASWFALIVSFAVASVALFAVLIVLVIVGVMCLFSSPLAGVALIGAGLVCAGFGLLFLMATIALAGIVTPAIVKGIVHLCKKCSGKKKEVAAS